MLIGLGLSGLLPARGDPPPPEDPATVAPFLVCEEALAAGCAAFQRSEFEAAAVAFRPGAERGDPAAQNNLGVLHEAGLGAARSKEEALRWYRRGAEQGLAMAQYNLGVLLASDHVLGTEAPERRRSDFIEAYAWILVAAHQGLAFAERTRRDLALRLTPEEVGEARERARSRIGERESE